MPYMKIIFSEQFQKKTYNWWKQIHVFLIGKGLPNMHNHEFESNTPEQGIFVIKF